MRANCFKSTIVAIIFGFMPFCGQAAQAANPQDTFQTNCVNSWMKRVSDPKDKVDYKNFGEKYCECAGKNPLDSQDAINKTMQLCMSQTLLQDTMDSLENEVGLDKANDSDINEYCEDRFTLVFPQMNDNDKKASANYCGCAKPKLMAIIKSSENLTDKQYSDQINDIAAACSSGVQSTNQATTTDNGAQTTPSTTQTNSNAAPATSNTTDSQASTPQKSDDDSDKNDDDSNDDSDDDKSSDDDDKEE